MPEFNVRYLSLGERSQSFDNGEWPHGSHYAQALADAGFYYLGEEDRCQCCKCGLGLYHWKPREDDPIKEHEKHRSLKQCDQMFKDKAASDFRRPLSEPCSPQSFWIGERYKTMIEKEREFLKELQKRDIRAPDDEERVYVEIARLEKEKEEKVEEAKAMEKKAKRNREWDQLDYLCEAMKPLFETVDNLPQCSLVTAGVTKEELKMWMDAMIEENIMTNINQQVILDENRVTLDIMRAILRSLGYRPFYDLVVSMKLLDKIVKRDMPVIKQVRRRCIKHVVAKWVEKGVEEARTETVIQIMRENDFKDVHRATFEQFVFLARAEKLLTDKQNKILNECLNPKQVMAEMMSKMPVIKYIRLIQQLERAGGWKAASELGQPAYLREKKKQPGLSTWCACLPSTTACQFGLIWWNWLSWLGSFQTQWKS